MVDPREGEVHRKRYHRRPVLCLAADDKYVVTGSEDKTIAVFDRRAGQVYKTMQVHVLKIKTGEHFQILIFIRTVLFDLKKNMYIVLLVGELCNGYIFWA